MINEVRKMRNKQVIKHSKTKQKHKLSMIGNKYFTLHIIDKSHKLIQRNLNRITKDKTCC